MTSRLIGPSAALALLVAAAAARAQDIEPRAYSNAPIGVNFLGVGYAFTQGGLAFDPSVPVTNAKLETSNAFVGYGRVIDLFGQSAKLEAALPYSWLSGTAQFMGQPIGRDVNGFGDSFVRLSANLVGAPAMDLQQFKSYKQDTIVGASLQVSLPTGQYDPSRLVNLGTNRWSFKPQVGVSQALGPLTLELTGAVAFYTDNTNFLNGHTRSQDPIYSVQGHAIYSLGLGPWVSADATYFTGGQTEINGVPRHDLQQNWRTGGTVAVPLSIRYSVKLFGSTGVSSRTGSTYDLVGMLLQYRWGAGL